MRLTIRYYDGFQPVTHAFVLQNGQYQRIDVCLARKQTRLP